MAAILSLGGISIAWDVLILRGVSILRSVSIPRGVSVLSAVPGVTWWWCDIVLNGGTGVHPCYGTVLTFSNVSAKFGWPYSPSTIDSWIAVTFAFATVTRLFTDMKATSFSNYARACCLRFSSSALRCFISFSLSAIKHS